MKYQFRDFLTYFYLIKISKVVSVIAGKLMFEIHQTT